MESKLGKMLEKLKDEEQKEINIIKEKYGLERGKLKKQCTHKYDNGDNALKMAGYPFHKGWDECEICGTFIETNEYGEDWKKVIYNSDMEHWDGLTRGKIYIVVEETETQYKVKNDIEGISSIQKNKFITTN